MKASDRAADMRREADRLEKAVANSSMSGDAERLWMGRPRLETVVELRAEAALLERGGS